MAIDVSVKSRIAPIATPRSINLGLALAVIAIAQLMVVLDTAVVNVALPSIQRALQFSSTGLEWVVNGYALAFGGLLLLGGRAGDLFGRRRVFVGGVLLFSIASLAGGLATTAGWLVAARIVQGVGGAIVAPTALSLVADTFPEGRARNRAFGIYSAVSGAGGALGLLLGGVLTSYASWRWVLFINVPIGIALAVAAPRVLAATAGRPGKLDLPGAATVSAGMALLVYGLNRAATNGWTNNLTLFSLAAAVVAIAAFLVIEVRSAQPLMPLRIFASRNRSGAYAVRFALGATLGGVLFFLTQYLQNILGYSPIKAGLAFVPITAGVVVGAQLGSRLIARVGPQLPMMVGALLGSAGLLWLSRITVHAAYATDVLGPILVFATGLGLIFVSTTITAVAGVQRHESGLSSALVNVGQQLGSSLGLAVLGTIAVNATKTALVGAVPTRLALAHAIVTGYGQAFDVASAIALGAFVVALLLVRRQRPPVVSQAVQKAA